MSLNIKKCIDNIDTSNRLAKESNKTFRWMYGYIHDKSIFHMNPFFYKKAKFSSNIHTTEKNYQRVYNTESYATTLTREIYQQKIRQNIKLRNTDLILDGSDEPITNCNDEIIQSDIYYSCKCKRVGGSNMVGSFCTFCHTEVHVTNITSTKSNIISIIDGVPSLTKEKMYWLLSVLSEIAKKSSENHVKVLAFYIVLTGVDHNLEMGILKALSPELYTRINAVQKFDKLRMKKLNEYIGSRYQAEPIKKQLEKIFKEIRIDTFYDEIK